MSRELNPSAIAVVYKHELAFAHVGSSFALLTVPQNFSILVIGKGKNQPLGKIGPIGWLGILGQCQEGLRPKRLSEWVR